MVPPKRPTDHTTLLPWLAGITVVLAALLAWDWSSDGAPSAEKSPSRAASEQTRPAPSNRDPTRSPQEQPSLNPLARLKLDSLHDTLGRPLFEKLRRPVEPPRKIETPAVVRLKTTASQSALTLVGVLKSGGVAVALLKHKATGQSLRAEEGDIIDGWTVKQIDFQRVVLAQGDREISLQLFRKPKQ
jgi:hypothetical protein